MMAISTKLALLVFVLPLSILIISDIVGFLVFGVLYIEVIAIFTSNWVFLLVWERLRESLDKKLEYLDETVFIGLYEVLYDGSLCRKQEEIEKAKNELQRHGKFTVLALYPKNLIKELNKFLQLHESFYDKMEQLLKISEEKLGEKPSKWTILGLLGFNIGDSHPANEAHQKTAISIQREHSKLIDDAKIIFEEAIEERKRILDKFEEFLKQNSLRLQSKPVEVVSSNY